MPINKNEITKEKIAKAMEAGSGSMHFETRGINRAEQGAVSWQK